ncbi:MAG: J domain-containing protein [Terracidiphilus sp.]|jgi:hypothetical protein
MACDCGRCRQHYKTLGFAFGIPEEAELQEAYRESIKQWNPDLYQDYASLRADAEEHYKQIQIAYLELKEHNGSAEETAETSSPESDFVKPENAPSSPPSISFNGAPGCLVGPQFTSGVEEIIARHLGKADTAVAIVDISGAPSHSANYAHFFLLSSRGIMVRDIRNIVSLLWYKDLGEVNLIDKRKGGKLSFSQRLAESISGSQHNYSLQINKSDGSRYFSFTDQVDDSVKEVIYNFILRQKNQAQR